VADDIRVRIRIPLIHIAEVTAGEITKRKIDRVGLLGTRYTMEDDFFKDKLLKRGIEPLIPVDDDRAFVHETIFGELGKNIFKPETKVRYLSIMNELVERGARGMILGCTEIPMLIKQEDCPVPTFDTLAIHAHAAVEFALGNS
jgi:aspartate racemase